jgi:hypothetical protein
MRPLPSDKKAGLKLPGKFLRANFRFQVVLELRHLPDYGPHVRADAWLTPLILAGEQSSKMSLKSAPGLGGSAMRRRWPLARHCAAAATAAAATAS